MGGNSGGGGVQVQKMDDYVKSMHSYLMWGVDITGTQFPFNRSPTSNSLFRKMELALEGNTDNTGPYVVDGAVVAAYNPGSAFAITEVTSPYGRTQAAIARLQAHLDAMNANYDTWLDEAVVAADESLQDDHYRSLNRVAGFFSDINAVQGSAFAFAITGLENARQARNAKYRSDLQIGLLEMLTRSEESLVKFTDDFSKFLVVAETDRQDADFEFQTKALMWDLNVIQHASQTFGSITGAAAASQFQPRKGSSVAGALGAGMSGAAAGFAAAGPVGGLIGGIGGLLSGL